MEQDNQNHPSSEERKLLTTAGAFVGIITGATIASIMKDNWVDFEPVYQRIIPALIFVTSTGVGTGMGYVLDKLTEYKPQDTYHND